jgi:hypothetical protein
VQNENKEKQESKEGKKEGTDDFGSDLDTDGFRVSGLEGLERDKRGELVVLLPDEERAIARQRGFFLPASQEAGATGKQPPAEKGSQFTGVLVEEPAAPAPAETPPPPPPPQPEAKPAPAPVDYGPTQVLVPDSLQKQAGPSVEDFDLDFGAGAATAARRKRAEDAAPPEEEAPKKVKKTAAWEAPKEEKPMASPGAAAAPEEPPKEDIPFQEPELPEDYSAPIVLKRRRAEKAAEKPDEPEPDRIKARSYLDDERVIEEPAAKAPARVSKKKKKMKLPRKVREGRKTSPLLVLMLILVLLVLAGVLAVQYVPEARDYYEKIMADISGTGPSEPQPLPGPTVESGKVVVTVGAEKVFLSKDGDKKSAEAYAKGFREALRQGKAAISGDAK